MGERSALRVFSPRRGHAIAAHRAAAGVRRIGDHGSNTIARQITHEAQAIAGVDVPTHD